MFLEMDLNGCLTGLVSHVTGLKKQDTEVAGPYRRVRTFRDPEGDIREYSPRGIVFANPEDKLYFVDAIIIWPEDPSKPSEYFIRELGFKEMSGLPPKGAGHKHNMNEWEEAKKLFIGEAPDDVKSDLQKILGRPQEWSLEKNAPTAVALAKTLGLH